jgi:hypothetical protein
MSPDLPADFCRFVDVYEAWSKDSKIVNGVDELKVEVGVTDHGYSSPIAITVAR